MKYKRWLGSLFSRGFDEPISTLQASKFFDKKYYESQLVQIGESLQGLEAHVHYERIGDRLRLNPHPLFDCHYYHEEYADVAASHMSALFHFIKHGHREGRNPHPVFDTGFVRAQVRREVNPLAAYLSAPPGTLQPHALFDETYVLSRIEGAMAPGETVLAAYFRLSSTTDPSEAFSCSEYASWHPDIGELHPFYHYVRWGAREGRQVGAAATSIRGVADEIDHASTLDPEIIPPHANIHRIPRVTRLTEDLPQARLLHRILSGVQPNRQTMVYLVNDLVAGGAERVLANLAIAQASDPGSEQILVLATGGAQMQAQAWLPREKTVVIAIADQISAIGDVPLAASVIATALQMVPVRGVCVVNSAVGWSLIEHYGKALRSFMTLAACTFCYDFDAYGRRAGYAWTDLSAAIEHLDIVLTDNARFKDALCADLHLSDADRRKIQVLYQPVAPSAPRIPAREALAVPGTPAFLWAGRFTRQKRIDIALAVAARMPSAPFYFAGGTQADAESLGGIVPPNAHFLGPFTAFGDLPVERCAAFLYTSDWDGLPNVLLEAAAAGLPIIASDVGGIPDLIGPETGWLIAETSAIDAYVDALRAVIERGADARARAGRLADLVAERHAPDRFAAAVRDLFPGTSGRASR